MDFETQKKLEAIYANIQAKKTEKQKAKQSLSKERKAKLYGNSGIVISHTESGKLCAVLPVGFGTLKFSSFIVKNQEQIQNFKNDLSKQTLKL